MTIRRKKKSTAVWFNSSTAGKVLYAVGIENINLYCFLLGRFLFACIFGVSVVP